MPLFRLLKNLPLQLISCLIFGFFFGHILPPAIANVFYTISCIIKDVLMLTLPFVIFTYIWAAIVSLGNRGLFMIGATFGLIILANMTALFTAYLAGGFILPSIIDPSIPQFTSGTTESVTCLWSLSALLRLNILQTSHGLFAGLILGVITLFMGKAQSKAHFAHKMIIIAHRARDTATTCLKKGFIPFLPLYVVGFVIKLARDGHLTNLLHGFAHTFLFICLLIVTYLIVWYGVGSRFHFKKTWESLKEMAPAGMMGFTTMSSSATMPVTLAATEKNLNDEAFADFFIPSTVNSHLAGDGLSITITTMALLLMSGHEVPPLSVFFVFAIHYCLVKFSAAGVPGGGVIVILPVVQKYLGLDDALIPLLQTIYMLQDPFLTSANVMGNGAFAQVAHRLMRPLMKEIHNENQTIASV